MASKAEARKRPKTRYVHTEFWDDSDMLEHTPEDKYFYLYLLTNPHTTQCGIYEVSVKQMTYETGYNHETIDKLIERFEGYGKIRYNRETKEMAIRNWTKYNLVLSPTVLKNITATLALVKDESLIPYVYSDDTISILKPYGIDKVKESKVKEIKSMYVVGGESGGIDEKPVDNVDTVDNSKTVEGGIVYDQRIAMIAQTYQKVFCRFITPMQKETLLAFLDDGMEPEVIVMALEITSSKNKDGLDYTFGILRNWLAQGVKTKEQAEDARRRHEMQQASGNQRNVLGGKGTATFEAMARMQQEKF